MADTKITGLPANTTPVSTDVTLIIDDPGGTPVSQKITLANLMALFANPVSDDGDALGTGALRWSDLFLAEGGVLDWNNGGVTIAVSDTSNQITISGATVVPAAGTTTIAPITLIAGTLMTTPGAGSVEMDTVNMYGTTDSGNRGYLPVRHLIRTNATRTYTSNVNAQNVFNDPANGRLTIETGTYKFQGLLSFGSMSGTSGNRNLNVLGGGSATLAEWRWIAVGFDGSTGTAGAGGVTHMVTSTSPASIVTATTGTSLIVYVTGSFECTGAGTVQPQTTMVTAAASTLGIGSWMEFERIGDTGRVSIGQWD